MEITDYGDQCFLIDSLSLLILALPQKLCKVKQVIIQSRCMNSRRPSGSVFVEEANVDVRVILNFLKFVRCIVCQEDKGKLGLAVG